MFHRALVFLYCFLSLSQAYSQITLYGRIVDAVTGDPVEGVIIRSSYPDETTSEEDGHFSILHKSQETVRLRFEFNGESIEWSKDLPASDQPDLGMIALSFTGSTVNDLPSIILTDDEEEEANISGLLRSGDDLFGGITDYTFSVARFNRRGLPARYSEFYLNGLLLNDLESGGIYYSNWGGLNDVMHNDAHALGAEASEWGFGNIGGTSNTDLAATAQWRKKISYAATNRNYRNRVMATWSSGLNPSGWAYCFSGSARWAEEGYFPGTFYDGWSWFASIDKEINENHSLNFVALGAPYKRGGNSAATREMFELSGDNYYNSYWGYQQGKKRSARIYSGHQPLFIVRHDWKINDRLNVNTSAGYQSGRSGVEVLDWLYGNDPRPDYYRRLPSYVSDPGLAAEMRDVLVNDRSLLQIQWDKLYEINSHRHFTVENANGIDGNDVAGALSSYAMVDRRSAVDKKVANIVLNYVPREGHQLLFGANLALQDTRNYSALTDLLGGDFYVDWDKFAETDFPGNDAAKQNDLNRPNRIVNVGDQLGYDYYSRIRQYAGWFSYDIDLKKWELALGGSVKSHQFQREGRTRNGKFPDNSFGESDNHNFFLPAGKALARYKIDGRNYFTISGMAGQMAPSFRNSFVSLRTRNDVVPGLEKENLLLGEARYDYTSPYLKFSLSGFYITSENGIESTSFYHDDERSFVNFSLTNIDSKFRGFESAVQYTLVPGLTFEGALSVGQYIYTSRPSATITQDNDGTILEENITVYLDNFHLEGTPQRAYTLGLTYKSKHYWTLYFNLNRFEENYISLNPLRRTQRAIDLVEYQSEEWYDILREEKVDPVWTVDASFYKSFKAYWIRDDAYFDLNIGITNVLNDQDYVVNGYEQYRFDFESKDVSKFPSRYLHMQGLTYFIQAALRF